LLQLDPKKTEALCESSDASDEVVKVENSSVEPISLHRKESSQDTDTFCPARCVRINGTSPRPARREVIFLASKIGTDGLVVAERKGLYDEPRIRMDGRRDVDLDGDRRTGGGSTGRRD
jgi:hypothetical protein